MNLRIPDRQRRAVLNKELTKIEEEDQEDWRTFAPRQHGGRNYGTETTR